MSITSLSSISATKIITTKCSNDPNLNHGQKSSFAELLQELISDKENEEAEKDILKDQQRNSMQRRGFSYGRNTAQSTVLSFRSSEKKSDIIEVTENRSNEHIVDLYA